MRVIEKGLYVLLNIGADRFLLHSHLNMLLPINIVIDMTTYPAISIYLYVFDSR